MNETALRIAKLFEEGKSQEAWDYQDRLRKAWAPAVQMYNDGNISCEQFLEELLLTNCE